MYRFFQRSPRLITAGLLLLALLFIVAVFHFNGLYGQDAHEYLRLSRALSDYFKSAVPLSHSYFSILYPLTGYVLSLTGINDIWAIQLVSMLALVAAFFYLSKLLQLLYPAGKYSTWLPLCFFAFSPYVLRFGLLSMSDMLCLFFLVAACYYALSYLKFGNRRDILLSVFFCSSAISTRYAVTVIVVIIFLLLLQSVFKRKDLAAFLTAIPAAMLPLLPDLLLRKRLLFFDLSGKGLPIDYGANAYSWSPLNFFRNHFENADGYQHYDWWNIIGVTFNVIHPAFLFAGLILLFFMRKEDFESAEAKWLLLIIISYALFLAGLQYQNNRYLLQSFPFVLIVLYPAFARIIDRFFPQRKNQLFFFACILIIQQALFCYSFRNIYEFNRLEKEIATSLSAYPGKTIYTCSITGALQSYRVNNPIVDLFFIVPAEIQPGSLLLFNYTEFSDHFGASNPMIGWNFINSHYHLQTIRSYRDGWMLYAIGQ